MTSNPIFVNGDIFLLLNNAFNLLYKKHGLKVENENPNLSYLISIGCDHEVDSIKSFSESVKVDCPEIFDNVEKLDQSVLNQFTSYLNFYQENLSQLEKVETEEVDDYLNNLTFYLLRDIRDFALQHEKIKKKQKDELFSKEVAKLLTTSFSLYLN
jgi:hypothetical protein